MSGAHPFGPYVLPPDRPKAVGPCIEYDGYIDEQGYGRLRSNGRRMRAHRLAYEEANGPIPDGMTVDHLCFNTACVNPDHLRLLTLGENAANSRTAYKTHCIHGHRYPPEDTYRRPDNGRRQCVECKNKRARRLRACDVCGREVMASTLARHRRVHRDEAVAA